MSDRSIIRQMLFDPSVAITLHACAAWNSSWLVLIVVDSAPQAEPSDEDEEEEEEEEEEEDTQLL